MSNLLSNVLQAGSRKRFSLRGRTSKYLGVGASNRKSQWQARVLSQEKEMTHVLVHACLSMSHLWDKGRPCQCSILPQLCCDTSHLPCTLKEDVFMRSTAVAKEEHDMCPDAAGAHPGAWQGDTPGLL